MPSHTPPPKPRPFDRLLGRRSTRPDVLPDPPATDPAAGDLVVLADGNRVLIRPITPVDAVELTAGFARLSARSRYQRFFTGGARLPAPRAAYLTQVDHHDHEALIAVTPAGGIIVGVARFIRSRTRSDSAEIAMTIADRWQARGLGGTLLRRLVLRARAEGITHFTADVLADNHAMLALFDQLGTVELTSNGATVGVTVSSTRAPDATPGEDR